MKETNNLHGTVGEDNATPDDLIDTQAAMWFSRHHAKTMSPEELAAFDAWLQEDELHREAYQALESLWNSPAFGRALQSAEKTDSKTRGWFWGARFLLPLGVCLALSLLVIVFQTDVKVWLQSDFRTAYGEQQTVRLGDGSTVILNTDSAINVSLTPSLRTVRLLKGEAFFQVEHDVLRPFLVYGSTSVTRVTGTRFFVYAKNGSDEISVSQGRVEVTGQKNPGQAVALRANDTVFVSDEGHGTVKKTPPDTTISWLGGHLVYQNAALSDVVEQIQRYRRGYVYFRDDALRSFRINGRINLGNPDNLLEILRKTLPVTITNMTPWLVIIG